MLTPTLLNVRSMLLRSAGIPSEIGIEAFEHLSASYESGLQTILANDNDLSKPTQAIDAKALVAQASWGGVLEVTTHMMQRYENSTVNVSDKDVGLSMRPKLAIYLLRTLDDLGEYHTLLQFALKVLALEDMDVISCIVSIARFRLLTILALSDGASLPLRILDTYCICRATSPPSRVIVQALLEIFTHLQVQGRIQEYLQHEIVLWDQTFAVMACSPLSDLQTDVIQSSASLLDDLEGIVSQAQVLEVDTVERVLAMLSARLLELQTFSCLDRAALRVVFQRVRVYNANHLVLPWLADQFKKPGHRSCAGAVSVLISCGGISTQIFIAAGAKAYEAAVHASAAHAATVATTVLGVLVDVVTNDVLFEVSFPIESLIALVLTLPKAKVAGVTLPGRRFRTLRASSDRRLFDTAHYG